MSYNPITVLDEIAVHLASKQYGVVQKTIFKGELPASPISAIGVILTGGNSATPDPSEPVLRLSLQLLVRERDYKPGMTLAQQLWNYLDGKVLVLTTVRARLVSDHVPGPMYRDANQNRVFPLNFAVYLNPTP